MITQTPYRLHGYTKPGQLVEDRIKVEDTMQGDPPEFVATCLNCPQAKCTPDATSCPLKYTHAKRVTKSGEPDRRCKRRPRELVDSIDKQIIRQWKDGWRKVWIAQNVGISPSALDKRFKRLERMGLV